LNILPASLQFSSSARHSGYSLYM